MTLVICILTFDAIFILETIASQSSAIWWILQNDELRDNLNIAQTNLVNSHKDPSLNYANLNDKVLNYQDWDPLSIKRFNRWNNVSIWNWDSKISCFISKWCIWDSSDAIHQGQMNSPNKLFKHVQEQTRHARMQFKESYLCDSKNECKHFLLV